MKTYSCASTLIIVLVLAGLAGCGGGGDGGATVPLPASGGGPPPSVAGPLGTVKVIDTSGLALEGVTVLRRGTLEEARTDATGQASLRARSGVVLAWQLYRDGLVTQLQQSAVPSETYTQSFVMLPREPSIVRDASVGGIVSGKHGLALTLPSNALGTSGGSSVDISLTPIDTSGSGITAAPSTTFLLQPWDYNNETILSYGMVELAVRWSGGGTVADLIQPATLDIPLYATLHPDGRAIAVGERIAVATLDRSSLVYFNSEWHPLEGIGEGEVVAGAGSPTGLALRMVLPPNDGAGRPLPLNAHFSAIALPGSRSIEVNVIPPAGEMLPAKSLYRLWGNVTSRGAPQAAFDYGDALSLDVGISGHQRRLYLPRAVAFEVRAEVVAGNTTYFGTTSIPATTPEMSSVQLALTRVVKPLPFITYPNGVASYKIGAPVEVRVEFSGPQPNRVELYADQTLIGEVSGQRAFYAFLWSTSGLTPSTRSLYAVAHDGTTIGRSSDVQVVLIN